MAYVNEGVGQALVGDAGHMRISSHVVVVMGSRRITTSQNARLAHTLDQDSRSPFGYTERPLGPPIKALKLLLINIIPF